MQKILTAMLLLLICAGVQAQVPKPAFVPEDGLYWNPDQPGRGYSIEIQDRYLFIVTYVYSEQTNSTNRDPFWYFAGAPVNDRFDFSSRLKLNIGGQCLDCNYVDAETITTSRRVNIEFQDATHAILNIDGEVIPIERFWFSPSISGLIESLLGQWKLVVDYSEALDDAFPFEADIIVFDDTQFVEGSFEAVGIEPTTGLAAAGAYDDDQEVYIWVVERTDDLFQAYYFFREDFGTNRFSGFAERFYAGDDLTGQGFPVDGFRTADRTFVEDNAIFKSRTRDDSRVQQSLPSRIANTAAISPKTLQSKRLKTLNDMARKLVSSIGKSQR